MGNIAINGFGRIGRSILRIIIESNSPLNVVAINDLGNYENLAYLLKHDSVMGVLDADVSLDGNKLKVNERTIDLISIKNPKDLFDKDQNSKNRSYKKHRYKFDLHGFSLIDANKKVKEIITECYNKQFSEILLVTGKGRPANFAT